MHSEAAALRFRGRTIRYAPTSPGKAKFLLISGTASFVTSMTFDIRTVCTRSRASVLGLDVDTARSIDRARRGPATGVAWLRFAHCVV